MNNITIAGNISQAAEIRYTPKNEPVAVFSVADNQGNNKPAIFWKCELWGKRAESLSQYLQKGQAVTVSGTVTEEQWKDKTTGADRKGFKIRVADVALQGGQRADQSTQQPKPQAAKPGSDFEDDIPF